MEPKTLADALTHETLTSLLATRLKYNAATIQQEAETLVARELHEAAVEARANEIRAYYSKSLWQRLLSKLPFTVQRRKQP